MDAQNYDRIEDLKRLNFIVRSIQSHRAVRKTRILDIGCGNGVMTRCLGRLGYRVHGIDISYKAITKARTENNNSNVTFDVIAAKELRKSRMRYDIVICSELLEHLDDPGSLTEVVHELLYNDGKFIVTVPNGNGPRELFITRPVQFIQERAGWSYQIVKGVKFVLGYDGSTAQSAAVDLTHKQFFSKKSLINLLESSGFELTCLEHSDCLEAVFPYSLLTKRFPFLQRVDCVLADILPSFLASGFYTTWSKIAVQKQCIMSQPPQWESIEHRYDTQVAV